MEISPIRQLKNLTIEARHTLSLQESKKKRLQFEKSLFLPNNKKRKDVLKTFNKKSFILNKIKEMPKNYFSKFKELKKQPSASQNKSSNNSDISSEGYIKSERSFPMKRSNKEFAASEEAKRDSSKKSTEKISFPSYVAYRTKGNKLMFIQNKIDQPFPAHQTAPRDLEHHGHHGLWKSLTFGHGNTNNSITKKRESTTHKSNERPSISNFDFTKLKAHTSTSNIQESTVMSENTLIDLTQKSPTFERPSVFSQSTRSQSEVIISDSPQPVSMSAAANVSPCLPSTSSNSMEFLIQSTAASNESTAFSSDYLETSNAETSNNIHNNQTPNRKPIVDVSAEADETAVLMKATSPIPLSVIVSNENLLMEFSPNSAQLIQDAQVQSTTSVSTLHPNEQPVQNTTTDELTVSTSNTEDVQDLTTTSNNHQETLNEQASVHEPSSLNLVPNLLSKVQDVPKRRYFDAISLQRQTIGDESTASTSVGGQSPEQHGMQNLQNEKQTPLVETMNMQSQMHGQISENPIIEKSPEGVPNFVFNSLHNNPSTSQQTANLLKTETQPKASNEEFNPLSRMQNMPNSSRYFTPFYLQRSVIPGTKTTTPSTSILNRSSVEQQQPLHAVTNESPPRDRRSSNAKPSSNTKETQSQPKDLRSSKKKPSSSTRETSNVSNQTKAAMEAHAYLQACKRINNQTRATPQIFSQLPPHVSEQNNNTQQSSIPGTSQPSKTIQGTIQGTVETPRPDTAFGRSTTPVVNQYPYFGPSYPPSASGYTPNQPYFPPFPPIQQQNIHSNNVPNTSHFKNSTNSRPPIATQNFYGYPPRNDATSIHQGNPNGQPYFPGFHQNSSANQTGIRTDYNQNSYDSRNFQPPNMFNNEIMRHHSNNPSSFWGQHTPSAAAAVPPPSHYQPSSSMGPNSVDPNQWLNDRFQQTMRPNNDNNDRSTWLARPQEPIGPISTGPVDIDAWVRARTQQAVKPPTIVNEQRLAQMEIKIDKCLDDFRDIRYILERTAAAAAPPPPPPRTPVTMQTSAPTPWQTNNSPIIGNIATQPVPDSRMPWGEYYNQRNTMQMEGNTGYPRTNAASQNFIRMDGNPPVNQYPVPQQIISHQINAADSTTGGNSNNSLLDLRSFRPTQHYHQSNPHIQPNSQQHTYPFPQPLPSHPETHSQTHPQTNPNNTTEIYKNQYIFF